MDEDNGRSILRRRIPGTKVHPVFGAEGNLLELFRRFPHIMGKTPRGVDAEPHGDRDIDKKHKDSDCLQNDSKDPPVPPLLIPFHPADSPSFLHCLLQRTAFRLASSAHFPLARNFIPYPDSPWKGIKPEITDLLIMLNVSQIF